LVSIGGLQLHLGVEQSFQPAAKAPPALVVDDLGSVRSTLTAAGTAVDNRIAIMAVRSADEPGESRR
jgi:hypothetical protein